jgi:hypothetical protein
MDRRAQVGVVTAIVAVLSGCSAPGPPAARHSIATPGARITSTPTATSHHHARSNRHVPLCDAKSLAAHGGRQSDGSSFAAMGAVVFKNVGRSPCALRGVPSNVAIRRDNGADLKLRYSVTKNHPVLRPAVLPVGEAAAASMDLVWLNWCGGRLGPLTVRIRLPRSRGTVVASFDGPPNYNFVPSCGAASRPSRLKLFAAYSPR